MERNRVIIISGDHATGKSTLSKYLSEQYNTAFIDTDFNLKYCDVTTDCIVIDEIATELDFINFNNFISRAEYRFRPPYARQQSILKLKLIIGVFQKPLSEVPRHAIHFNLSK